MGWTLSVRFPRVPDPPALRSVGATIAPVPFPANNEDGSPNTALLGRIPESDSQVLIGGAQVRDGHL